MAPTLREVIESLAAQMDTEADAGMRRANERACVVRQEVRGWEEPSMGTIPELKCQAKERRYLANRLRNILTSPNLVD